MTNIITAELIKKLQTNISPHQVLTMTRIWDVKYKNLQNEIIAINDRVESVLKETTCFNDKLTESQIEKKANDIFKKLDNDKDDCGLDLDATKIDLASATHTSFNNTNVNTTIGLINTMNQSVLENLMDQNDSRFEPANNIFNKTDKITAIFLMKMNYIYETYMNNYLPDIVRRKQETKMMLRTFSELENSEYPDKLSKLINYDEGLKNLVMIIDKTISNLNEVFEAYSEVYKIYETELPGVNTRRGFRNKSDKRVDNLTYAFRYVKDEVEVLQDTLGQLQENLVLMLANVKLTVDEFLGGRLRLRKNSLKNK